MDRIIFCVFLEKDWKIYRRKLYYYFPPCSSKAQEEELLRAREREREAQAAAKAATGLGDTSETNTPYSTVSESGQSEPWIVVCGLSSNPALANLAMYKVLYWYSGTCLYGAHKKWLF